MKKKKNSGPNKLQANLHLLSMTKLQHMVTTSSARQNVAFGLVGVLSEIFVAWIVHVLIYLLASAIPFIHHTFLL